MPRKDCDGDGMTKKERIKQLTTDMTDVVSSLENPFELEMDHFTYDDGDQYSRMTGWYAWMYKEGDGAYPIEDLPEPLITDMEIEKFNINIRKVFNEFGCYYCG